MCEGHAAVLKLGSSHPSIFKHPRKLRLHVLLRRYVGEVDRWQQRGRLLHSRWLWRRVSVAAVATARGLQGRLVRSTPPWLRLLLRLLLLLLGSTATTGHGA